MRPSRRHFRGNEQFVAFNHIPAVSVGEVVRITRSLHWTGGSNDARQLA